MGANVRFIGILKEKIKLHKAIKIYGNYYVKYKRIIQTVLHYYVHKRGYNIAIWGAGLKGKAFLKVIDSNQRLIKYVYDIDDKKIGNDMPTGHKIVDYTGKYSQNVQIVLLMNNNFETEVAGFLEEQNMDVILLNVDSIIAGELTAREIVKLYRKEI